MKANYLPFRQVAKLVFIHTLVRGVMSLEQSMFRGSFKPYVSPLDPCPPIKVRKFVLPPPIFMNSQPPGLEQVSPREALMIGTLWPQLADGFYREEGIS